MRLDHILRNVLMLLFVIYFAQDWLYVSGSVISKSSLVIIILISVFYFIKTLLLSEIHTALYRIWSAFILLNIYGFFTNLDISDGHTIDLFKGVLACMLPFYPFYYFAKKDQLNSGHFIKFFLIMLPVIIFQYFHNKSNFQIENEALEQEVVNNVAYSFVSLLPFVFLIKRHKIISGVFMALIMMFIIQGAKRGALIAGFMGLAIFFYYQLKTIEKQKRIMAYLGVLIMITGITVFAYLSFVNNDFLLNRMSSMMQGDSSGREQLYSSMFYGWLYSNNFWHLLTGFGFTGSLDLTHGTIAHSDWLQLLGSLGLIGIFAYLLFFYIAVRQIFISQWAIDKRLLMFTLICLWFFTSIFSISYLSQSYFTYSMLFGFLTGDKSRTLV
jgi:hypothetical protein